VDLEGNRLFVLRKGYRERQWLSLTKTAKETIEQWMEWYRPGGEGEKGLPLFVNFDRSEKDRNGGRLTDSGLYHVVRKLGKMCGRNNIHPHAIRHTAVTQAVEAATAKGYNLKDVLPYSGHKNITTLMVYVDQQRDVQGDLAESVGSTV
jgi:integrase